MINTEIVMNRMNNHQPTTFTRRDALKLAGLGLGGLLLRPTFVQASGNDDAGDAAAMLYDATRCVGCRACEAACKETNGLPADAEPATDLSAKNYTVIKQHREGTAVYFRKYQCMHCLDPACVSACPVQALEKRDDGPVAYDPDKCIGCRYCMMACPFQVPKIDWDKVFPVIAKCTFCADRIDHGQIPACAEACPVQALTFGTRDQVLEEARNRIAQHPGRYLSHIYGETEGGGTSWMYLSAIPFEKLGLPELDAEPVPELSESVAIYGTPTMLVSIGALLGGIYWATVQRTKDQPSSDDKGKEV
jgi:formate dehydrogenase iron-sulfur subunit